MELFLREFPVDTSLRAVADAVADQALKLPAEPLLCSSGGAGGAGLSGLVLRGREVDRVVIRQSRRRADYRWVARTEDRRWIRLPEPARRLARETDEGIRFGASRGAASLLVATGPLEVEAEDAVGAVARSDGAVLLLPTSGSAAEYVRTVYEEAETDAGLESSIRALLVTRLVMRLLGTSERREVPAETLRAWLYEEGHSRRRPLGGRPRVEDLLDIGEFSAMIDATNWRLFDPAVWERREDSQSIA
jgi:hypothetical protein